MFITPSFKKSLIVEQFQGNYLNETTEPWKAWNFVQEAINKPLSPGARIFSTTGYKCRSTENGIIWITQGNYGLGLKLVIRKVRRWSNFLGI